MPGSSVVQTSIGSVRLVDQRVELRQRPVGEIADAVLLGRLLDADLRPDRRCGRGVGVMKPFLTIVWSTTPERDARRLDVGGRRIIGRRLDQAGDDRRFAEAEMVGAMAEEASATRRRCRRRRRRNRRG